MINVYIIYVQIYEKDWETSEEKRIKVLVQNGFPLISQF